MEFIRLKRIPGCESAHRLRVKLLRNCLYDGRYECNKLYTRIAPISACSTLNRIIVVADKMGYVVAISDSGITSVELSLSLLGVESLFAVDDHSVVVVTANHLVSMLTFDITNSKIDVSSRPIPILAPVSGKLSLRGQYCWNREERCMYYINNKGFIQRTDMQTRWKASFLCYSSLFGVLYVSENHHSLCSGSDIVFTVPFEISWVQCFEDPYVLIVSTNERSAQCILLDLCTSTSFQLSMDRIDLSKDACYWRDANCLLFTGTSAGELFVFELNSLSSTQLTNKVHHRIRLDCSHITTLHIAPPSHFLVGDDCGDVFSIHLSLSFVWLLKHSIHSSTITRLTRLVLP